MTAASEPPVSAEESKTIRLAEIRAAAENALELSAVEPDEPPRSRRRRKPPAGDVPFGSRRYGGGDGGGQVVVEIVNPRAPADDVVALTEGIENALSLALAWPVARVIACISVANIGAVALPDQLRDVVIFADNDTENSAAAAQLIRSARVLDGQGRRVRIARIEGAKDVNGYLMEGPKHDGQPDDPDGEAS